MYNPGNLICDICGVVGDYGNEVQTYLLPDKSACVTNCRSQGLHLIENHQTGECVCEVGYVQKDGVCVPCSTLSTMCDECQFDSLKLICTRCKSDYLVVSPDKQHCWNKLTGCETPLKDQTWDFFKANPTFREGGKDGKEFYSCPQCLPGYYWKSNGNRQGECARCSIYMKNCEECTGANTCTVCWAPYILLPEHDGCAPLIDECYVD